MLLAIVTAAVLRLSQLETVPPGLYRDEAYNGLDALDVLGGKHALFFPANNGREPLYIYLTAISVALFGRLALAVRLAAAIVGTLTTWVTYQLARTWFGWRVGLLSAWSWAITLWPVHLSRLGLRPILVAPLLALLFWVGTIAYRRQHKGLWFLSGLIYGFGFYTYLAFRFTPLLLLFLAAFLLMTGRREDLGPGWLWFGLGAILALSPLAYLLTVQPGLIIGRTGQVSIFNPNIHGGEFWRTFGRHVVRTLGLFLWRGDTILRHNPSGRPVFDVFMALPFLSGLVWCLRHWQRPAAMVLLAWTGIMLGPTILAEDAPHFLRAAGILPALIILPAIGLQLLWKASWPAPLIRRFLVVVVIVATSAVTVRDYLSYGRQPEVAYMFEAAAADMARQIRDETPETSVLVDEMFWAGWPSILFLAGERQVSFFHYDKNVPGPQTPPAVIYAWPYEALDFVPIALPPPALITAEEGGLARGDLEAVANPLFIRFFSQPRPQSRHLVAEFGNVMYLRRAEISQRDEMSLEVELWWSTDKAIEQELVVFVHLTDESGALVAQDDAPAANGHWPRQWWRPGLIIADRHVIELPEPYDAARQQVSVGVYDALTGVNLPVADPNGELAGDVWLLAN